ncbi:hypothetical protein [Natrarchaeobaculum sulfurireducens]|uniref:Uncharacterized protein n=1 Tax=Natrarchaeobaculum sulfurireducens TaxID=2044521 RepID=A0A346PL71_9EURY|nr:hypothetical protein [Natrarchaeobaculum sulfurireducens]AXR80266.1 hypothetical protein AArcMg_0243 [Natrarchaeobaculum sulfurireducens]
MTAESGGGVVRLRKSGVGVVLGGLLLATAATVLPAAGAAGVVVVIGIAGLVFGDSTDAVQGAVGVLAVGGIGLVEAVPGVGLGLEPYALAGLAVVFGVFDVLASLALRRLSGTSQ